MIRRNSRGNLHELGSRGAGSCPEWDTIRAAERDWLRFESITWRFPDYDRAVYMARLASPLWTGAAILRRVRGE